MAESALLLFSGHFPLPLPPSVDGSCAGRGLCRLLLLWAEVGVESCSFESEARDRRCFGSTEHSPQSGHQPDPKIPQTSLTYILF